VSVGEEIKLGQVLLSNSNLDGFSNASDLKVEMPSETERVAGGQDILVFAVGRQDDTGAPYLEIVGYAKVTGDSGRVTFGGFPGSLSGATRELVGVLDSVQPEFLGNGPWRSPSSVGGGVEQPDGSGSPPTSTAGTG
jgi:hypothetical protein